MIQLAIPCQFSPSNSARVQTALMYANQALTETCSIELKVSSILRTDTLRCTLPEHFKMLCICCCQLDINY